MAILVLMGISLFLLYFDDYKGSLLNVLYSNVDVSFNPNGCSVFGFLTN